MFYIFFIWLKGVGYKENRVQLGPPPAYSTRIYDTMSGIRVQVTQVASILSPPCNCLFDILFYIFFFRVAKSSSSTESRPF